MSDLIEIKPLRVDIAENGDGHSIKLNGSEFAGNIEHGSLAVTHDRKRNIAAVTVTFIVDELHWTGGLS